MKQCHQKLLYAQMGVHKKPNSVKMLSSSGIHNESKESPLPCEWYEAYFAKLLKLSPLLKNMDLIGERVVRLDDNSSIFDENIKEKLRTFKSIALVFLGCPSVQESLKKNHTMNNSGRSSFCSFGKSSERKPLIIRSLVDLTALLKISTIRMKVIRFNINTVLTHPRIWSGTLISVLETLKSDMDSLNDQCFSSWKLYRGYQSVLTCLEFLEKAAKLNDQTSPIPWTRLKGKLPKKIEETIPESPTDCNKWVVVLNMFKDIVITLTDEKLFFHSPMFEAMIEALFRIKTFEVDSSSRYWEIPSIRTPTQEQLFSSLNPGSRCLFVLLQYYLCNSTRDIEIEMCSGAFRTSFPYKTGNNKYCICLGRVLISDEEKAVWNGVRQLDKGLALLKFMWESSAKDGVLELQGHLFCIGDAQTRSFEHRGNQIFVHGITL